MVNILNQEAIQMSNSYSTLKDLSALEKKLSALERNPNQLAEYLPDIYQQLRQINRSLPGIKEESECIK